MPKYEEMKLRLHVCEKDQSDEEKQCHVSNCTNDNSFDEGGSFKYRSPRPMESPKIGSMMPIKGLDMILQLLQMESEQDENSQLVTYDDLELSEESNILAQEFLQSLACSSATDQKSQQ